MQTIRLAGGATSTTFPAAPAGLSLLDADDRVLVEGSLTRPTSNPEPLQHWTQQPRGTKRRVEPAVRVAEAPLDAPHQPTLTEVMRSDTWAGVRVGAPSGGPTTVPVSPASEFGDAIGQSYVMRTLFARLERAAATEQTLLLLGESGTGKEVLARAVHGHSPRRGGPFVVLDCGAVSANLLESELFGYTRGAFTGAVGARAGLLEEASGGTLFIDEIGEMPLDLQPKLLRALETRQVRRLGANDWRPFDARIIAATHRNLRTRATEGAFREDLYYRLAVLEVRVPALRERKDDIPALVARFLATYDPPRTLDDLPPDALSLLTSHSFPGNVRELRNVVARLVVFPELRPDLDLPEAPHDDATPAATPAPSSEADRMAPLLQLPLQAARDLVMEQFERSYVAAKLAQHGGNISRAADAMGVSRQLVHRVLERYGMKAK